jgi:hypothetical protein
VHAVKDFHHNPHGDTILHSRYEGRHAVYRVTTPWQAGGPITTWDIPWNEKGGDFTETDADTCWFDTNPVGRWLEYNITNFVKHFVNNPSQNYGVIIKVAMDNPQESHSNGGDTVYQGYTFASAEPDSAYLEPFKPQVVINYGPTEIIGQNIKLRDSDNYMISQKNRCIHIMVPGTGNFRYDIFTLSGKRLKQRYMAKRGIVNKISMHRSGIYIIRLEYGTRIINKRVSIVN